VNITQLTISGPNTLYKLDGISENHFHPSKVLHVNKVSICGTVELGPDRAGMFFQKLSFVVVRISEISR